MSTTHVFDGERAAARRRAAGGQGVLARGQRGLRAGGVLVLEALRLVAGGGDALSQHLDAGEHLGELRLALGDVRLVAHEDRVALVLERLLGLVERLAGDVQLGGGELLRGAVLGAVVGGAGVEQLGRRGVGAGDQEEGGAEENGVAGRAGGAGGAGHGVPPAALAASTPLLAFSAVTRARSSRVRAR
jgi:hypothetical protein